MSKQIVSKKVKLNLVGVNGNAFSVMGVFSGQARRENWTKEEIDLVLNEAMSDDYDHLLATIMAHCEGNGMGTDNDDEPLDEDENAQKQRGFERDCADSFDDSGESDDD